MGILQSEKYHIVETLYKIEGNKLERFLGKTREYPLTQAVLIDYSTIFESKIEFDAYLKNITQQFINQRVLENAEVSADYGEADGNDVIPVTLLVSTKDTWNIFPVPYPKYDSTTGFQLKFKVKDYNFLGTMHSLNFDVNYEHEKFPTENKPDKKTLGINCDFEIPFKLAVIDALWENSLGISYVFDENIFDFSFNTSFGFTYSLKRVDFNIQFSQSITQDSYYKDVKLENDDTLHDDSFYFTEAVSLNLPVKLYEIKNWSWIKWTPYLSYKWNCKDLFFGSNNSNYMHHEDLLGPIFSVGHRFTVARVNWIGNFRRGIDAALSNYIVFNKGKDMVSPGVSLEFLSYYSWKYAALNIRFFAVYNKEDKETVGERIRGIIDKSYKTNAALALNIDAPIHLFTTNFLRVFDFELQISPFIDISVGKNTETGSFMSLKDGYYTGGIELLVFPEKMRSIQGRISFGYDLTDFMPDSMVNKDWRSDSKHQLFIGVGVFY
ncbi:MAG: hypothetical protein NC041_04360 [Bacteroides sp.]|nr:hypothetical protein [Prevotella sp.]MCM1407939.1 hypothetical protein [Treponema brennaborense]MCM1469681.1 hypothetical protein [Bacteroides sp.]